MDKSLTTYLRNLNFENCCNYNQAKRVFDFVLAGLLAIVLLVPCVILAVTVRLNSKGPALYWSDRVGTDNVMFKMPKFRSMRVDTPITATHLLEEPGQYLTSLGAFLRKSSIDEFPQLWCVLRGQMSLVGPRPALFNQYDLIALRTKCNVHSLKPGITGLAQVRGRDDLSIEEKVEVDEEYLHSRSLLNDIKILLLTVQRVVKKQGVTH